MVNAFHACLELVVQFRSECVYSAVHVSELTVVVDFQTLYTSIVLLYSVSDIHEWIVAFGIDIDELYRYRYNYDRFCGLFLNVAVYNNNECGEDLSVVEEFYFQSFPSSRRLS